MYLTSSRHAASAPEPASQFAERHANEEEKDEALAAFIRLKEKDALFDTRSDRVEIISDKLFRAEINLPAGMPVGRYVSEFFAFKNGRLVGYQTGELPVDIVGAGHILHQAAYDMSLIYGIAGVVMALIMGWGGGFVQAAIRQ